MMNNQCTIILPPKFGVYEIGYAIEDPFQGTLRLSIICDVIRRDVLGDEMIRSTAFDLRGNDEIDEEETDEEEEEGEVAEEGEDAAVADNEDGAAILATAMQIDPDSSKRQKGGGNDEEKAFE